MDKKQLTETDIITKFVLPAIEQAGWDAMTQLRQEVKLRDGKVIVRGNMGVRKTVKSADIVLYHKPNLPLAVIEAKANKHEIGKGIQQGLDYARLLDVPFIFATNGDGFIFHDKTNTTGLLESEITLSAFPTPEELWQKYCVWKGYSQAQLPVVTQDYHDDGTGKAPRYYQLQAINKTIAAVSRGQNRVLLVMATGTGKTYTAFQIIWRLWKSRQKKRILFLADRNILVDQTRLNDFQPFGQAMTKITGRTIDPAYEIHLALYQALTGPEEAQKAYKQVGPDFFDLIIIDECHRGSAAEDSAWREILEYFASAAQIGLTATPKETDEVSNTDYFGDPVYTYSLKEGIEDGFLAPYKVVRVDLVVVVTAVARDGGVLREISRDLRSYIKAEVVRHFIAPVGIPRTSASWKQLVTFLTKNPTSRNYGFSNWIQMPIGDDTRQDIWKRLATLGSTAQNKEANEFGHLCNLSSEDISTSLELAANEIDRAYNSFLNSPRGETLTLSEGFLFFAKDSDIAKRYSEVSQSAIYLTMSAVLQCAREHKDHSKRLCPTGYESVVLGPECFLRFNDAVLQACLLRASLPSELDYSASPVLSKLMREFLSKIFARCDKKYGDAALEFAAAIALGSLRLTCEDSEILFEEIFRDSTQPSALLGLLILARIERGAAN